MAGGRYIEVAGEGILMSMPQLEHHQLAAILASGKPAVKRAMPIAFGMYFTAACCADMLLRLVVDVEAFFA